ncbi:MAG: efflux RND transporter periplasmic adaptor subunit [Planctomycetota bacterium]|nr:efflux RND transporter periplasmic adaptor subunit [Planctomycetota bacterium]
MRSTIILVFVLGQLVVSQIGCGPTSSIEASASGDEEIEPVVVTTFTPNLQLFMEYPRLIVGEEARFLAHLTLLASGEPIRSGSLVLEAVPASGASITLRADKPARDGLFIPEGAFSAAGNYRVRLVLESPRAAETIEVGEMVVHLDEESARRAAAADEEQEITNGVPFLLESQWKIPLVMEQVKRHTLVNRLQVPGEIEALQGSAAVVSPPVSGLLSPPPSGTLPRIGESVTAGQVLALIEPPLPVAQQVRSTAIDLSLRSFDLDISRIEADSAVARAHTRVEFASRSLQRITSLRSKDLATKQQLDEAQQDLRLAESERSAADSVKRSYDQAAEKLETLRSQAQLGLSEDAIGLPLTAPISGVVVAANHVEGEHLDAHAETLRLVNTEEVLLVARVSEFDLARVPADPAAVMTLPAYPGRRFQIQGDEGGQLLDIGRIVAARTRTVQIRYQLANPQGLFRIGMTADVFLETESVQAAIAVPEEAIVIDRGLAVVFVLAHGELFERREVTLGIRDGGLVEIKKGVTEGERVVTQGAYAVKLASLSPESFSHGHAH